jgi:hypothetical protein
MKLNILADHAIDRSVRLAGSGLAGVYSFLRFPLEPFRLLFRRLWIFPFRHEFSAVRCG